MSVCDWVEVNRSLCPGLISHPLTAKDVIFWGPSYGCTLKDFFWLRWLTPSQNKYWLLYPTDARLTPHSLLLTTMATWGRKDLTVLSPPRPLHTRFLFWMICMLPTSRSTSTYSVRYFLATAVWLTLIVLFYKPPTEVPAHNNPVPCTHVIFCFAWLLFFLDAVLS